MRSPRASISAAASTPADSAPTDAPPAEADETALHARLDAAEAALAAFVELCGDEETLMCDGFADCAIGMGERFNSGPVLIYDRDKMLERIMADGCTYEEAVEHFAFNIVGAWVGERTPIFLTDRIAPPAPGA